MVQQNKKKHQKFSTKRTQKRNGGKVAVSERAAKDSGKKGAVQSGKTQRVQRAAQLRDNRRLQSMEAARQVVALPRSVVVVPINGLADPAAIAHQIGERQVAVSSGALQCSSYISSIRSPPLSISYVLATWPETVKLEAIRAADIVVFAVGVGDPSLPELAVDVPGEALDTDSTVARSHITGMTGMSGGTLSALVGVDEPSRVMLDAVCFGGVPTVVGVVQGTRRIPQATLRRRILRAHIRFFNSIFTGLAVKVYTADFDASVAAATPSALGALAGPSAAVARSMEDDETATAPVFAPPPLVPSGAMKVGSGVLALRHHLQHVKVEVPKWRAARPTLQVDAIAWHAAPPGSIPEEVLSAVGGVVPEGVGVLTVRGVVKGTGGIAAGSIVHLANIGSYRVARVATVHLTSAGCAMAGRTQPSGEEAEVVVRSDLSTRDAAATLCGWIPSVESELAALAVAPGGSASAAHDGGLGVAFAAWQRSPTVRVRSVAEPCDEDADVVPLATVGEADADGANSQDGLSDADDEGAEMDGLSVVRGTRGGAAAGSTVRGACLRNLRGTGASVRSGRGVGGASTVGGVDDIEMNVIPGTVARVHDAVLSHEFRAPLGFSAQQAMVLIKRGLLDPKTGRLHKSFRKDAAFARSGGVASDDIDDSGDSSDFGSDGDEQVHIEAGATHSHPQTGHTVPVRGDTDPEFIGGLGPKEKRDPSAAAADDAEFPDEVEIHADGITARQRFANWFPLPSWASTPIDPTADLPADYSRISQAAGWRQIQAAAVAEVADAAAVRRDPDGFDEAPAPRSVRLSVGTAPTNAPGAAPGTVAILTLVGVPHAAVDAYLTSPYAQTARGAAAAAAAPSLAFSPDGPSLVAAASANGGACVGGPSLCSVPPPQAAFVAGIPLVAYGLFRHEQLMTVVNFAFRRHDEYDDPVQSKTPLQVTVGFRTLTARVLWSEGDSTSTLRVPAELRRAKLHRWLQPHHKMAVGSFYGPVTFPPCIVTVHRGDTLVGGGSLLPEGAGADPDRMFIKKTVLTGRIFRCHKTKAKVRHMFFNKQDVEWAKNVELFTRHGLRGHITQSIGTHGYFKTQWNGPILQDDTVCLPLYKRVFPSWTTVATSPLHAHHPPGLYVPADAAPAAHLAADVEVFDDDLPPAAPIDE